MENHFPNFSKSPFQSQLIIAYFKWNLISKVPLVDILERFRSKIP